MHAVGRYLLPLLAATMMAPGSTHAQAEGDKPHASIVPNIASPATPEGFVRTYGDVSPGAPRVAGAVLHACGDADVPWHRIVRADGSLAKGRRQRRLLEAEGVPFRGERVDMRVARAPSL
jgi:alkylated DNA nucleotide flippase Atl1